MAKTVKVEPVTTEAVENKPPTIKHLADLYDAVHKFDKEKGNEKAFLAKFGSRKAWLSQFKSQSYDKEV